MRMRNPKYKDEVIGKCDFLIKDEINFNDDHNIEIEIGMGKGNFILQKAINNPHINYIGIERYTSVLLRAIQKIEDLQIPNLRFICFDATDILDVFACHEVDRIYLNFSDPWPKDRHAKRRLTSPLYLKLYDNLFVNNAHIIQKTDNDKLFEYSLEQYKNHGYKINKISYDLHNEDMDNIETEYESKFAGIGIKIKYVDVSK